MFSGPKPPRADPPFPFGGSPREEKNKKIGLDNFQKQKV
jgi:hypothetical protein